MEGSSEMVAILRFLLSLGSCDEEAEKEEELEARWRTVVVKEPSESKAVRMWEPRKPVAPTRATLTMDILMNVGETVCWLSGAVL